MNVLMVETGKAPYETEIGDGLEAMQAAVGGNIQRNSAVSAVRFL